MPKPEDEVIAAAKEWQDARSACITSADPDVRTNSEFAAALVRLSDAEDRLSAAVRSGRP